EWIHVVGDLISAYGGSELLRKPRRRIQIWLPIANHLVSHLERLFLIAREPGDVAHGRGIERSLRNLTRLRDNPLEGLLKPLRNLRLLDRGRGVGRFAHR